MPAAKGSAWSLILLRLVLHLDMELAISPFVEFHGAGLRLVPLPRQSGELGRDLEEPVADSSGES